MDTTEAEEREAREKYFAFKKNPNTITHVNMRLWYPTLGNPNLLQLAVYYFHSEFVSELISRGADLDVVTDILGTALHVAVRQQNLSMIEILLTAGANPNIFSLAFNNTLNRWTPIYDALNIRFQNNDDTFVCVLLDNGSDVDGICFRSRWDPKGRTPLQIAINESDPSLVRLLLDYGANINILDSAGRTPLEAAIVVESREITLLIRNRILALFEEGQEVSEQNLQSVLGIRIN